MSSETAVSFTGVHFNHTVFAVHWNLHTCLLGYRYSFTHKAWSACFVCSTFRLRNVKSLLYIRFTVGHGWLAITRDTQIRNISVDRDWTTATIKLF